MSTRVRNLVIAMIMGMLLALGTTAFGQMADDLDFYNVIWKKGHLFRPLGWKAPDLTPRYRLILTKVAKKGEGTTLAYMSRSNVPNPMVVTVIKVGVEFDGSEVTDIQSNKVVLKNGVTYEQPAVSFLNTGLKSSRNNRRRGQTDTGTSGVTQGDKPTTGTESSVNGSTRQTRGRQQGTATAAQRERWRGQMGRFQNATPEERLDMIEQFRSQRGGRGRRNR